VSVTPLRPVGGDLELSARLATLQNVDAEQTVLGVCLINNGQFERAAALVREEHFANAMHGRIFAAIRALVSRGEKADPITLGPVLDRDPALRDVGGARYLAQLAGAAAIITDVRDYARIVADLACRREIVVECADAIQTAATIDLTSSSAEIAAKHVARITELAQGGNHLEVVNPRELQGLPAPERQWLVPDWVPMARVTGLYGAGGEGKTRLAQMLATASAIVGGQWLGLPVRTCNSLLVFWEDDQDEMHRRQAEVNDHFHCDFSDLSGIQWLPRLGHDNVMMTFADGWPVRTSFFDEIAKAAKRHGAQLLIIDTLADVFVGNENDRAQARMFAQQVLGALARDLNGAVIVLAHPSRAGMNSGSGESGSTAWVGTFRSQLYLSTPKAGEGEPADPDVRLLTRKKSNAARRDETIELRWRNGVFVPTRQAGILGSIERRSCERVFLDLLHAIIAEGRHVSENSHAPNYAPKLFAMRPDREGFTKADFSRAMQALFAKREIAVGEYLSSRHKYSCIVPTKRAAA
jgi:RecA-family ATPase